MSYLKTLTQGLGWMGMFRFFYRILGLSRIFILARILSPNDFGLFGIATIVLGFLEIFTETGINVFLIQEKYKLEEFINTAWVISIFRGVLVFLLIGIFSVPIANFFNSEEAISIILLISLVPLIRGFINPGIVSFQKNLEFNKEFYYRISVFSLEVVSSIILALVMKSAQALVIGILVGAVFEVFITFIIVKIIPKFKLNIIQLREILSKGKWVTGFGIFDYIYTQSDNIIVGKFLGQSTLGIYDNAYTISTSPLTEVGDVFSKVTFPIFSKLSKNILNLRKAFVKNFLINFLLMVPAGIFIFIFAEPIVLILLGENWISGVPIVKILAILGVVRGVANSTNSLLISLKKQKYSAITTFISALGLWLFLIPFVKTYGAVGAAYASILGVVVSIPFTVYFVHKALKSA